mmetsp:Transcript_116216/g.333735  ORF Transcript_116216/g.333735 Transcript_116216/m.333735 type:complete len:204 (-) Transcript_116216:482-1093(-)
MILTACPSLHIDAALVPVQALQHADVAAVLLPKAILRGLVHHHPSALQHGRELVHRTLRLLPARREQVAQLRLAILAQGHAAGAQATKHHVLVDIALAVAAVQGRDSLQALALAQALAHAAHILPQVACLRIRLELGYALAPRQNETVGVTLGGVVHLPLRRSYSPMKSRVDFAEVDDASRLVHVATAQGWLARYRRLDQVGA